MAQIHLFAKGHDNVAGLTALYDIDPPLFRLYKLDIMTIWHPYSEQVVDASLRTHGLGLPSVEYVFQVLSEAELKLIRDTFFDGGELDSEVTIQTYDKELMAALAFNATLHWPNLNEMTHDRAHWRDVHLIATELQLLSGFSSGFDPLAFGV